MLAVLDCSILEDKCTMILQNVRNYTPSDTTSGPRRPDTSATTLLESQISHPNLFSCCIILDCCLCPDHSWTVWSSGRTTAMPAADSSCGCCYWFWTSGSGINSRTSREEDHPGFKISCRKIGENEQCTAERAANCVPRRNGAS